ncbi:hypothetical protein [Aliivibrio fischeri]|uniref:hypothetical protein n=1 Tax=Aliivibrio fischeri TaxID=668 RepID=UPI0007C53952|nr:hypothetical protein [Aliivibrio fischeri]
MRKTEHSNSKPAKLKFKNSRGQRRTPAVNNEVRANIQRFNNNDALTFQYYKNLKDDVINLTKGRCAYCGFYTDVAIEHYRPKDGIAVNINKITEVTKPGYFWLASDWYNLLPSCNNCNCIRRREVYDDMRSIVIEKLVGKGNLFPLRNNTVHAPLKIASIGLSFSCKQIRNEEPLLMHPSKVVPRDIFTYRREKVKNYNRIIISPKNNLSGYLFDMARMTIDILGFNSLIRSKERHDIYIVIKSQLDNIFAINNLDDQDSIEAVEIIAQAIDEDSESSFIGMIEVLFIEKLTILADNILQHKGELQLSYYSIDDILKSLKLLC